MQPSSWPRLSSPEGGWKEGCRIVCLAIRALAQRIATTPPPVAPAHPGVVELPAEGMPPSSPHQHYRHPSHPPYPSGHQRVNSQDKYMVVPEEAQPPRVSAELPSQSKQREVPLSIPKLPLNQCLRQRSDRAPTPATENAHRRRTRLLRLSIEPQ